MMRFVVGLLTGAVLAGSLAAVAQTDDVAVPRSELEAMRDRIDQWLESTTSTSSTSSTTSTSSSSSTTSTSSTSSTTSTSSTSSTTSTSSSTTSSSTSSTTSTTAPAAEGYPAELSLGGQNGDKDVYDIMLSDGDPDVKGDGNPWWEAPYLRFLPVEGVGWTDGDRCAYRSAYGFLIRDGRIVGRFTFVRVADYGVVNDKYMAEEVRYWSGAPDADLNIDPSDCPAADQEYLSKDVDQRPVVRFVGSDGVVLETRDYRPTVAGEGVTFELAEVRSEPFAAVSGQGIPHTVYSRVTVVARENGLPIVVVYYDALVPSVQITGGLE